MGISTFDSKSEKLTHVGRYCSSSLIHDSKLRSIRWLPRYCIRWRSNTVPIILLLGTVVRTFWRKWSRGNPLSARPIGFPAALWWPKTGFRSRPCVRSTSIVVLKHIYVGESWPTVCTSAFDGHGLVACQEKEASLCRHRLRPMLRALAGLVMPAVIMALVWFGNLLDWISFISSLESRRNQYSKRRSDRSSPT